MMQPKKLQRVSRENTEVRDPLKRLLQLRGWYVKVLHGNKYQSGLPDLYATHKVHGTRFIECKLPGMVGSAFTKAQREVFPKLIDNGTSIWILVAATEYEYKKLFCPSNFMEYWLIK